MDLIERAFAAQAKVMREFGYPNVTADDVRSYHADWKADREPKDIVARFCESAFEERPDMFGAKETTDA